MGEKTKRRNRIIVVVLISMSLIFVSFYSIYIAEIFGLHNTDEKMKGRYWHVTVGKYHQGMTNSIQEAVDLVKPHGTIEVGSGEYYESISVYKSVKIIGNGSENTWVIGNDEDATFTITASWVDISGINISNQAEKGDGIRVSNANYISIINNSCIGTFFGIYLTSSSECHIVGNTLIENSVGIFCYETTRVTIEENQLYNNTLSRYGTFGNGIMIDHCHSFSIDNNKCKLYDQNGIRIRFSSNNTVSNNQIRNDRNEVPWGAGILITGGKENIITGNYHENNFCALRFDGIIENNSINYNMYVSNVHGVVCYGKNYVHDNFFLDNRKGINIYGSPRLKVYNNTLTMNHIGVSIDTMAFENKIYHNVIENSTKVGIKIESTCVNNTLYQNNLINNSRQVNDMGINIWNDEKNVGNYWSNYNGSDNGSKGREACDGIGDTNLPCNDVDFYPLIEPWSRDE